MSQNVFRYTPFLFLVTVFAACSATSTVTLSPTQVTTNTPVTPTVLSATSALVSSPTILPTLSVEEATQKFFELLSNNGECRLPCFWGITPGKSVPQNSQVLLSSLSTIRNKYAREPRFDIDSGSVKLVHPEGTLMFITDIRYKSDNDVVNHIYFHMQERERIEPPNGEKGWLDIFHSATFGKQTQYYSLTNLLSEQGMPDAVMIATSNLQMYEGAGGFHIWLVYSKQGILVKYTTQMYVIDESVRGCPAYAHVEMNLYPAGNPDAFYAFLEQDQAWVIQRDWRKPIEEVTSMTLNQFYETFHQPTDQCIETPSYLWTPPQ